MSDLPATPQKQAEGECQRLANELAAERARLNALQSVTEVALSTLALDDLLRELLRRVRDILAADTATILLLAEDGQYLEVRASSGLEEEVREHVRIPLGRGVAGRIMATRAPEAIEDLSAADVFSPIPRQCVRSLAGVPLLVQGRPIGVLHVGTVHPRRFSAADVQLLQFVAERAAMAIENARLYEERDRVLREVERERTLWRTTVDNMPNPVTVSDAEGHATYMNDIYFRMLGLPIKVGLPVSEHPKYYRIYHPDGTPFEAEDLPLQRAALRDEQVRDVEIVHRRPDGREFIAVFSASPLHDERGRVIGAVAVGRDVTAQRRAEAERERLLAEVEEQRTLFETVIENVPAGVVVLSWPGLVYELVNPAYRAIVPGKEVLGRTVREVFPEIADQVEALMREVMRTGQPYRAVDMPFLIRRAPDAPLEEANFTFSYLPIHITGGRDAVLALAMETTEGVRARRRIEEAVHARDQFLAAAAHELKTPITNLRGYAQMSLRRLDREGALDPQRARQTLQTIDRQSDRLARLVNQLLDVASLEAGQLALQRQSVDLASLVQRVVADAQAATQHHTLRLRTPPSAPAHVDPARIEQVLANLLDNAIKFSPEGTPIDVELSTPSPDWVRLTVRDYGPGVPPERRARLFSRFYQAQTGRPFSGLGLGLYSARQIVERHGGHIAAEFPEDGGSRFTVELPTERTDGTEGASAKEGSSHEA